MASNKLEPKVVLGVGAHPDDLEFGAGGSLAKWAKAGAKVYSLICTDGSKGSADLSMTSTKLIKIRRQEQQAAAKILGLAEVFFLDYEDGRLESNYELKRDIAKLIRQLKPDAVISWDPTVTYTTAHGLVNHSDHRAAGLAALDAVYPLARGHLSLPELLAEGLQPHKVETLLMINLNESDYYEDVSDTFDTKIKALRAHTSQFPDSGAIARLITDLAKQAGQAAGCQLAEGFKRLDIP